MNIAIIGSGISGLTAAYLLHKDFEIDIYEQNDYVGGHANTVDIAIQGKTHPVDTGFIVFNQKTYPNFVKMLKLLNVPWINSNMSFSVHCEKSGLEYSPSSLSTLFAQTRNIFRFHFWRMLLDIFRFRRNYQVVLDSPDDMSLENLLSKEKYSRHFIDYFITPMGAAIWSADPDNIGKISAKLFVSFFHNHGFLNIKDQPQWLTVQHGSRQYVKALVAGFKDRIHLNTRITSIRRDDKKVFLETKDGISKICDHVIISTHSDQALKILSDPSEKELKVLKAFPYQLNNAYLHTDINLLPGIRKTWASWNYFMPEVKQSRVILTYNMNMLQNIESRETICVTLNADKLIDSNKIIYNTEYAHPIFTGLSWSAKKRHAEISGVNRTHYCGAYWGNGFHEDGVNSALAVCKYFGKEL